MATEPRGRPLRPWDFMGRRGMNVRNPRRIAVEDGDIACLACLRSGRFATHDGHSPQHPPDSMPKRWLVSETPRWGELPLGTTLTLTEYADSSFVDETGPNSSVDRTFLYLALNGSAAGQFFQISTSVAASDSEASGFPSFLLPVDALTQAGVQALVNRSRPAPCQGARAMKSRDVGEVLVIDDERTFRFPAVYARTADEGKARLAERPWRELWLDYNLGAGLTIEPVMQLLEERAARGEPLPIGVIYIHTSDPDHGDAMISALTPWYRVRRVVAHSFLASS